MLLTYTTGVLTPAGWRPVTIVARADRQSAGIATVREVLTIDGEAPAYGQSRTGAKRQEFDGRYVARTEVGKNKRLSACLQVEE